MVQCYASVASIIAAATTHPFDTLKVRLQLQGISNTSIISTLRITMQQGGVKALYWGVTPAALRAVVYGGIRYSIYSPIKKLLNRDSNENASLWKKIVAGSLCGCFASAICNPTDLVKVRMQTYGPTLYSSIFDATRKIYRSEGLKGFFVGVIPTSSRATVLAATELSTYDETKETLIRIGLFEESNLSLHLCSSIISGFMSTVMTTPFDFAKSRIMNSQPNPLIPLPDGPHYKGMLDCMSRSVRNEGFLVLWSGFGATFIRLVPNITITFLIMEQLRIRFD